MTRWFLVPVLFLATAIAPAAQGAVALRAQHAIPAAQRLERDPASRHQRARGGGESLVSRRLGPRASRPHRLRAPVRARDVRRLDARAGRRIRRVARGRRRQQQRLDQRRSHQLLHRPAVERARPGAVPRIGSHGLPARRQGARQDQRPARRREERETIELRQSALRAGVPGAADDAVSARASLQLVDDRLDGRSHGGQLRGRGAVLPHLLRARTTPAS